jgi:hypothetical protein
LEDRFCTDHAEGCYLIRGDNWLFLLHRNADKTQQPLDGAGSWINEDVENKSESIFSPMYLQYRDALHIICIASKLFCTNVIEFLEACSS